MTAGDGIAPGMNAVDPRADVSGVDGVAACSGPLGGRLVVTAGGVIMSDLRSGRAVIVTPFRVSGQRLHVLVQSLVPVRCSETQDVKIKKPPRKGGLSTVLTSVISTSV
jgi:hypothetical protein